MKYLKFVVFLFVFTSNIPHSNAIKAKPSLRKIIVAKGDSSLHFTVCNSSLEIKCKNEFYYFWYSDNRIHSNMGSYSGRLIHGEMKTFNQKGDLVEEGELSYGIKKGIWKTWYSNGSLKSISKWKKGKKEGKETLFNSKGQKKAIYYYKKHVKLEREKLFVEGKKYKEEKIKKPKRTKGEKKLKVEKFNRSEKRNEKKKEKENRQKYQWFKNLLKSNKEEGTTT